MLAYPVLAYKERIQLGLFFAFLGAGLGSGFIPTALSFWSAVGGPPSEWAVCISFPVLALCFYLSLTEKKLESPLRWGAFGEWTALFALGVAGIYGLFLPTPAQITPPIWTWNLVAIPVGEELLFRGWLWRLALRFRGESWFSFTNALPSAAVLTSLSFAFWHLQNFGSMPAPLVLWQVAYSFFAGLWLAGMRTERGLVGAILAHAALNLMTALGQILSPW